MSRSNPWRWFHGRPYAVRGFLFMQWWLMLVATGGGLGAELTEPQEPERNVDGFMDNSFFIEEAYNQEVGVVQHIFSTLYSVNGQAGSDDELWALSFTQEWPIFSQAHQFSYTIPYNFTRGDGIRADGLGDILLNYRYQAFLRERTHTALAPRASLLLPTGKSRLGFGDDSVGAQFNLPFSTAIGDSWFGHLNAGLTWIPDAASTQRRDLLIYNLGGSVIYAATRDLHFLLEWVGYWSHVGEPGLPQRYEFVAVISPGVRKAFNFRNESQIVVGAAAPIGLTESSPDIGVFLYFSFEHHFKNDE